MYDYSLFIDLELKIHSSASRVRLELIHVRI